MVNLARKIKNTTNDFTDVEVIRYFINNDTEYLIYSLNEIDESGYTKLYASKIIGTKACIITDNEEWTLIKEIIKEIVRNNRDGSELNIVDLDESSLDDINDKIEEVSLDYEELYKEQIEKNKELELEIDSLEEQIDKYKELIDKIKEIVE